ncbi:hypothetical protein T06_2696 [Trichinella sp. T6]|nr:hypothetical protein T06_2696 [Trichinella sp. T6]
MIQFPLCRFQNQIGRVEIFSNNFILLICTVRLMHAVDLSFSKYIFICRSRRTVQLQPFPPYNHFYYNHSKYVIKNVNPRSIRMFVQKAQLH